MDDFIYIKLGNMQKRMYGVRSQDSTLLGEEWDG